MKDWSAIDHGMNRFDVVSCLVFIPIDRVKTFLRVGISGHFKGQLKGGDKSRMNNWIIML